MIYPDKDYDLPLTAEERCQITRSLIYSIAVSALERILSAECEDDLAGLRHDIARRAMDEMHAIGHLGHYGQDPDAPYCCG